MWVSVLRNKYKASSRGRKGGISARLRQKLELLHREATDPFSVERGAEVLGLEVDRARRLLAYLASRGWLVRVCRGLYAPVPLDASAPSEWQVDPWATAAEVFAPCYIGGWSACEHWGLTDQLFRDIVVITGRKLRDVHPEVQGVRYQIKQVAEERLFGVAQVWRGSVRVPVSDPSRTVLDAVDDPALVGGIRHGSEVLSTYFEERSDEALLLEYAVRLGNRTVYKRLGYLCETLDLGSASLRESCRRGLSQGFSLLDPSAPARGPYRSRWRLRLNVALDGGPGR